jgi:hypothetical protein
MSRVHRALQGATPPDSWSAQDVRVLEALTARGVLEPSAPDEGLPAQPSQRPVIVLEGRGKVAEQLSALLAPAADVHLGGIDDDTARRSDVCISCAGLLPDGRWTAVDRLLSAHATPWHRCYREDDRWVIGPLSYPGRTAGYRDTRARLVAASSNPTELEEFWAYLDTQVDTRFDDEADLQMPDAIASIVAGILATDVTALLDGVTPPTMGHQVVLRPTDLSLTRHPVLPLPEAWAVTP